MKIGFLGGSFDPVHNGHLAAAADARDACALDRVVFVPAAQAPLKGRALVATADDRLAMLRAAVAGDARCEVSDCELRRGGVSYTVDTARHFRAERPGDELFWIIGADQLAQLPRWREIAELARLVGFIVVERPGHDTVVTQFENGRSGFIPDTSGVTPDLPRPAAKCVTTPDTPAANATTASAAIPRLRLTRVTGRRVDISSTELRERLRRGEPVDAWMPQKAVVYLREKHLYC